MNMNQHTDTRFFIIFIDEVLLKVADLCTVDALFAFTAATSICAIHAEVGDLNTAMNSCCESLSMQKREIGDRRSGVGKGGLNK